MDVNDIQIGGKHYQREYQHWDMVCDLNLHYLLACATKYISRWREKNGVEDLRKSLHYISKAEDISLEPEEYTEEQYNKLDIFCEQLYIVESNIVKRISFGFYDQAREFIQDLIDEVECGATANYVDPDNNYIRG